jgi:hypothetical protein
MGMTAHIGWTERASFVVAHVVSWPGACVVLVGLLLALVYRLLAERARRRTLIATYRYAPGGTVVVQEKGPGGPAMWVWVGEGQRPPPLEARVVWVYVGDGQGIPPGGHG